MITGASFTIEIRDEELREALADMVARMDDMRPFLQEAGDILLASVKDNIHGEHGPDGKPWARLKPKTISDRIRAGRSPNGILRRSGVLYETLTRQVEGDQVRVGASTPYAAIHQFGGTIRREARAGTVWHGRLRKGVAGRRFAKKTNKTSKPTPASYGAYTITMPARPYLGMSSENEREILEAAGRWLEG